MTFFSQLRVVNNIVHNSNPNFANDFKKLGEFFRDGVSWSTK